jgi:hypothetical protein
LSDQCQTGGDAEQSLVFSLWNVFGATLTWFYLLLYSSAIQYFFHTFLSLSSLATSMDLHICSFVCLEHSFHTFSIWLKCLLVPQRSVTELWARMQMWVISPSGALYLLLLDIPLVYNYLVNIILPVDWSSGMVGTSACHCCFLSICSSSWYVVELDWYSWNKWDLVIMLSGQHVFSF